MHHVYCRHTQKESTGSNQEKFREDTYLYCHLTYTQIFFLSSVELYEPVSPGKGGVKEMPVQNDSIIHYINHSNLRRNKIHSHMSSIFPGRNTTKEQRMTKL